MSDVDLTSLPSAMPATFPAGTTVKYVRSYPAYPASAGWKLTSYIAGAKKALAEAEAQGDFHLVTFAADDTGVLASGTYTWSEWVEKDDETYQAGTGQVVVTPNIKTAADGDLQSWEEKLLPKVRESIEKRSTRGLQGMSLEGRSLTTYSLDELRALERDLVNRIKSQKTPDGGSFGRPVLFGFSSVGFDQ